MNEFEPIIGLEHTMINRDGVIISRLGRMLKNTSINGWYPSVKIKGHRYRVHRLVAKQFLPNPNNYPQVNHKNGIKTDNRVDNLEWCTQNYNSDHAKKMGLIMKGHNHHKSILDEIQVLTIRKCHSDGMLNRPLSEYFKVDVSTIDAIVKRRNWRHI